MKFQIKSVIMVRVPYVKVNIFLDQTEHFDRLYIIREDVFILTVKIIGKFQEVDGEEYTSLEDLIRAKGLVPPVFGDDGQIHLLYDTDGNTYAVSRNAKDYYGVREEAMNRAKAEAVDDGESFVVSLKSLIWTAGLIGLTVYVISNHRSTRKHLKYIRN